MHYEDDILNVFPTSEKINSYTRKGNNCDDDYSMVLLDEKNLGDTIIYGNAYLIDNPILEIRNLVLSSIHIDLHTVDAKLNI